MSEVFWIFAGFLLGTFSESFVIWLLFRSRFDAMKRDLESRIQIAERAAETQRTLREECEGVLRREFAERTALTEEHHRQQLVALEQAKNEVESRTQKELAAMEQRHREEIENVQGKYEKDLAAQEQRHREALENAERIQKERTDSMRTEFRSMSAELLKQQSETARKTHLEQLDSVITPLRTQMNECRESLEKTKNDYNKLNGSLAEQCRRMIDETKKIGMEADQLTNALTADVKTQGDWGEMILDGLLQNAGLIRDVHYTVQDVLRTADGNVAHSDEGKIMRTDVIVHFPDGKDIVIDSKVSLTAYMRYANAVNPEDRVAALREHCDSVKKHIGELARKRYCDYPQGGRDMIDFTVMFVPVEPALSAAFSNNPELWEYANNSKVCVVSPMNLVAMLRIVKTLWTRSDQEKNHLEIIKTADQLMKRICSFYGCMDDIRKKLSDVETSCDQAAGLLGLQKGKHSIGNSVRKLLDLGVKASAADMKKLQKNLLDEDNPSILSENTPEELPAPDFELSPAENDNTESESDHA